MSLVKSHSIWVSRALPVAGAHVRFECRPGELTLLSDEDGNEIGHFEQAFRVARASPDFQISREDASVDLSHIERLGFEDRLSVELTIPDYLKSLGLSASEVENALIEFDLDRSRYLYCSQLPLPAARQLQIFELLRRDWTIIFMRDPFQPLNGRWREDLARRLMEEVRRRSAVAIASSISFIPQKWNGVGVRNYDVGQMCAASIARANREIEQRAQILKAQPESQSQSDMPASAATLTATQENLPTVESSYKPVVDFIFDPLARISNLFRHNTPAAICTALALTLGLVASIAIPEFHHNQALMRTIAHNIESSAPRPQMNENPAAPLSSLSDAAFIELQPVEPDSDEVAFFWDSADDNTSQEIGAATANPPPNFETEICGYDGDVFDARVEAYLALQNLISS